MEPDHTPFLGDHTPSDHTPSGFASGFPSELLPGSSCGPSCNSLDIAVATNMVQSSSDSEEEKGQSAEVKSAADP